MPNPFDTDEVSKLVGLAMEGEPAAASNIHSYLGYHENLAAGVHADIFDLEVINMMTGGRIIAMEKAYRPWVAYRREATGNPCLYIELEWLASELFKLRSALGLQGSDGQGSSVVDAKRS